MPLEMIDGEERLAQRHRQPLRGGKPIISEVARPGPAVAASRAISAGATPALPRARSINGRKASK